MRWVYAIFRFVAFLYWLIHGFSVIKILQKSKYTFFVLQYSTVHTHICACARVCKQQQRICTAYLHTLFSYLYIQFGLISLFCLLTRIPVQSYICCVLVCLYGVFYFFVSLSLFFTIVGRTCAKSNIAKDSICTAFVRSLVGSVALVYFDLFESKKRWCKMA